MTETLTSVPATDATEGVIGDRQLACVQTIDIGRLRSAPVPLTPNTFVAVTGRGPRGDSNGSGKTTFLGAVSLLLGEIGWRPATGAPEAASLLFDGTKAGVDVERYARAERGYIMGVFLTPEEEFDPITVCLRISATPPYLKARYKDGIHLVDADTAAARAAAADALWESFPKPDIGSRSYAAALYGSSPRCVAWLQVRGNETPGKSLLKLAQERMEPHQIGLALLELLGRDDLIHADAEARSDLDTRLRELRRLQEDDLSRRHEEDVELSSIAGRQAARANLANTTRLWQLHFAKGFVDSTARTQLAREEMPPLEDRREAAEAAAVAARSALDAIGDGGALRSEVIAAEQAEEETRAEHEKQIRAMSSLRHALQQQEETVGRLRQVAGGWDGISVDDAMATVTVAEQSLMTATEQLGAARAEVEHAARTREATATGGGGLAGALVERLTAANVHAVALMDQVIIEDDARDIWEPRLSLYSDAAVITHGDRDAAVAAADPGDVLIVGLTDEGPLPHGIAYAPPAAVAFLNGLSGASAIGDRTAALLDEHVIVAGGFLDPITGRTARMAAAERVLTDATNRQATAQGRMAEAETALASARFGQEAALAHRELLSAEIEIERMREELRVVGAEENGAARLYAEARERKSRADREWGGFEGNRGRLETELRRHEEALNVETSNLQAQKDEVRRLESSIEYWRRGWARDLAVAETALEEEATTHPSGEDRSNADSFRRAANKALDRALRSCGIDTDSGDGAPAGSDVGIAVTQRATALTLSERVDDQTTYERQARLFHGVVDALDAWLGRLRVEDDSAEAHIMGDRFRREEALSAAQDLCDERERNLPILQDQIDRTIRTTLSTISQRLNELDLAARGDGADLKIDSIRPTSPKESWQWRVTPRYRRGANGPLVPYLERANTATEKLLAIHLVLAALFAATSGPQSAAGRILILDELGDSLGDYHREAVLSALAKTATTAGITVLGTCQDGVLEDAAKHTGLILYFQFRDPSDILNAPTRVFGTSAEGLIEQTGKWVERLG